MAKLKSNPEQSEMKNSKTGQQSVFGNDLEEKLEEIPKPKQHQPRRLDEDFEDDQNNISFQLSNMSSDISRLVDISVCSDVSQTARMKYDECQRNVEQGMVYEMVSFPPNRSSISSNPDCVCHSKVDKWLRIPCIYERFPLFGQKIDPSDVQQGGLGDCYLLTAFAVLTQKPNFLKRIFHSKSVVDNGLYAIWIYDSGCVRLIQVDDNIPCGVDGKPCFSRSKTESIWVLLLEKAYASMFGSYENIESGSTMEALNFLTGAPTVELSFEEEKSQPEHESSLKIIPHRREKIWSFIQENLSKGYLLTASSLSRKEKQAMIESGIISNHAYGLYDARILKMSGGTSIRAVKLRNPWGRQDLLKACKEKSEMIVSALKKQYNIDRDSDQGMFWMDYEDFRENYEKVTCCKLHDDYKYKFLSASLYQWSDWGLVKVKLTVKKRGLVYISVHQPIERGFKKLNAKDEFQYSYVRILLVELQLDGKSVKRFVKGKYKASQQPVLEQVLDAGEYLAFIEVDWRSGLKESRKIIVSTYSQRSVKIIDYKSPENAMDLYDKVIRAFIFSGHRSVKTETFEDSYNQKSIPLNIKLYQTFKFGLSVYLFSNNEKDITFELKMTEKEPPKNMKLFYPKYEHGGLPHVSLEPGKDQLVIIKTISMEGDRHQKTTFSYSTGSLNYGYQFKYPLEVLKKKIKEYGKNDNTDELKQISSLSYGGGVFYYVKNLKAKEVVVESDLDCEGLFIHDSEMNYIAPNQKLTKVLKEGEEYVLNFEVKRLGESISNFPAICWSWTEERRH